MRPALLLLLLALVTACTPAPLRIDCTDDDDCAEAQRCERGRCAAPRPPAPPVPDAGPDAGAALPRADAGPEAGPDGCVDGDGDGRGPGCPAGPDCDDGDPQRFETLEGFGDADGDGARVGSILCTDGSLPPGFIVDDGAPRDCDDAHPGRYPGAVEVCDLVDNDCDGEVDPEPVCPCPVLSVQGRAYLRCDERINYEEAGAACKALQMRLATPRGVEANLALGAGFATAWIGLDDRAVEGTFTWADGELLVDEDAAWRNDSEPNNAGGLEHCVELGGDGWNDQDCDERNAFICEPPPPGDCADGDGDGRGAGCRAGPDCDDGDPAVWGQRGVYPNADGDALVGGGLELRCVGDASPALPLTIPAGRNEVDCDDTDPGVGLCDDECYEIAVGGQTYAFCLVNAANWDDARARCQAKSGDLAILDTRREAVAVKRALYRFDRIVGGTENYWIGLRDNTGDNLDWRWVNGAALIDGEDDWDRDQPNSTTQRCADLRLGNEAWRDNECTLSERYICEL